MKKILLLVMVLSLSASIFSAEKITGLWKSIDDTTGLVKSVSIIYEKSGKVYGRLLVTYEDDGSLSDPNLKTTQVVGEPTYTGLDFIWDMTDSGKKWSKGKILDPLPGKIYSCDMWIEGGNLIVRGKIGPFGRSQTWVPVTDLSTLPEWVVIPTNPTPKIPKVK
ncbi:MAG: DUF2147 domain-containing protein [Spirochaetales bacterium]|nr:DUF2147 domain-containing protein [Spirochaetales bacterium]